MPSHPLAGSAAAEWLRRAAARAQARQRCGGSDVEEAHAITATDRPAATENPPGDLPDQLLISHVLPLPEQSKF